MRINITIPDDWHAALTALAERKQVSLSKLLCQAAAKKLTAEDRARLTKWRDRGREKTKV
jgi:hypothetical protein